MVLLFALLCFNSPVPQQIEITSEMLAKDYVPSKNDKPWYKTRSGLGTGFCILVIAVSIQHYKLRDYDFKKQQRDKIRNSDAYKELYGEDGLEDYFMLALYEFPPVNGFCPRCFYAFQNKH